MTETFKPGDVVQLNSGGPKMTVTQVGKSMMTSTELVWCVWFDKTEKKDGEFPPNSLKKASGGGAIGALSSKLA